jgi:hypothetical protein
VNSTNQVIKKTNIKKVLLLYIMCTVTAEKLFALEDRYMKQGGLYAMWTTLFIINMICMVSDSSVGAHRDFNLISSLLCTI